MTAKAWQSPDPEAICIRTNIKGRIRRQKTAFSLPFLAGRHNITYPRYRTVKLSLPNFISISAFSFSFFLFCFHFFKISKAQGTVGLTSSPKTRAISEFFKNHLRQCWGTGSACFFWASRIRIRIH
jgi:hypothetical protein